jgi:hypothetical protein
MNLEFFTEVLASNPIHPHPSGAELLALRIDMPIAVLEPVQQT